MSAPTPSQLAAGRPPPRQTPFRFSRFGGDLLRYLQFLKIDPVSTPRHAENEPCKKVQTIGNFANFPNMRQVLVREGLQYTQMMGGDLRDATIIAKPAYDGREATMALAWTSSPNLSIATLNV